VFAGRYFPRHYFAARYFPEGGDLVVPPADGGDYFGDRYFAPRYFGAAYWGPLELVVEPPAPPPLPASGSGGGGTSRRRVGRRKIVAPMPAMEAATTQAHGGSAVGGSVITIKGTQASALFATAFAAGRVAAAKHAAAQAHGAADPAAHAARDWRADLMASRDRLAVSRNNEDVLALAYLRLRRRASLD
jgi:hypothetical protein